MKKLVTLTAIAGILLFAGSCKEDAALADGQLSYSFQASNLSASIGATGAAGGTVVPAGSNGSITWTGATANVAKIEFAAKRAGTAISLESKNIYGISPLRADSLAGTVALVSGVYENIQLKLNLAQSASNPPLLLTGTYTEATGTKIPVVVQINSSQEIKLESARLEVSASSYVAKVTLELNNLVKGLTAGDFGQTTRSTPNNTIIVNSTINTALYNKLLANLPACATLSIAKK